MSGRGNNRVKKATRALRKKKIHVDEVQELIDSVWDDEVDTQEIPEVNETITVKARRTKKKRSDDEVDTMEKILNQWKTMDDAVNLIKKSFYGYTEEDREKIDHIGHEIHNIASYVRIPTTANDVLVNFTLALGLFQKNVFKNDSNSDNPTIVKNFFFSLARLMKVVGMDKINDFKPIRSLFLVFTNPTIYKKRTYEDVKEVAMAIYDKLAIDKWPFKRIFEKYFFPVEDRDMFDEKRIRLEFHPFGKNQDVKNPIAEYYVEICGENLKKFVSGGFLCMFLNFINLSLKYGIDEETMKHIDMLLESRARSALKWVQSQKKKEKKKTSDYF